MAAHDSFKVIMARWVDISKGDHRARLVGQEIKTHPRLDLHAALHAATPPLESF